MRRGKVRPPDVGLSASERQRGRLDRLSRDADSSCWVAHPIRGAAAGLQPVFTSLITLMPGRMTYVLLVR